MNCLVMDCPIGKLTLCANADDTALTHIRFGEQLAAGDILCAALGDRVDRVMHQLEGERREGEADEGRDHRLDLAVAVRMLLVGRGRPIADAEDDGEVRDQIGK